MGDGTIFDDSSWQRRVAEVRPYSVAGPVDRWRGDCRLPIADRRLQITAPRGGQREIAQRSTFSRSPAPGPRPARRRTFIFDFRIGVASFRFLVFRFRRCSCGVQTGLESTCRLPLPCTAHTTPRILRATLCSVNYVNCLIVNSLRCAAPVTARCDYKTRDTTCFSRLRVRLRARASNTTAASRQFILR